MSTAEQAPRVRRTSADRTGGEGTDVLSVKIDYLKELVIELKAKFDTLDQRYALQPAHQDLERRVGNIEWWGRTILSALALGFLTAVGSWVYVKGGKP